MLVFILSLVTTKSKILFLFILSPIKKIKIEELAIKYNMEITNHNLEMNKEQINTFIPIMEINLPFFTTSYIYIKYIILISIYLFIPILIYFIYISIINVLKTNEAFKLQFILTIISVFVVLNLMFTHYIIIPIFINFIFSHYSEFLFYEFDVEFQLLNYLDFYINILFLNLLLFTIITLKKYLNINIHALILLVIIFLLLPFDIIIQIIYVIIFLIYYIINSILYNYYQNIKKYKQMEY